ncbi:hypothetical protein [Pseudoalteromonas sp. B530]|uniref:hypothetical protein n=1 Tax=Pseudoalteromonas sp. B530 TaxID=2994390 RepID=UPI00224B2776|nr:hypothetical protein [Pseudoalteromonas sp. B530]MCX2767875.1 hypothetical protein [Pseudoalteromonas sp. B530]
MYKKEPSYISKQLLPDERLGCIIGSSGVVGDGAQINPRQGRDNNIATSVVQVISHKYLRLITGSGGVAGGGGGQVDPQQVEGAIQTPYFKSSNEKS